MTVARTEFDRENLSELDFDPPCDCRLIILSLFGRTFVMRRCHRPARWTANMACCNHETLSCPQHRYHTDLKWCLRCKQYVPRKLRWRRI